MILTGIGNGGWQAWKFCGFQTVDRIDWS